MWVELVYSLLQLKNDHRLKAIKYISATNPNNFCKIYHALILPDCFFLWVTATVDLGARHLAVKATWFSRGRFPFFLISDTFSHFWGNTERRVKGRMGVWVKHMQTIREQLLASMWSVGLLSWNLKSSLKSDRLIWLGLTLLCLPAVGWVVGTIFYCSWIREGFVPVKAESKDPVSGTVNCFCTSS